MVITGTVYWKFQQSLVSQATLQPSIMFADPLSICLIAVEIVKTNLNTPIWNAWGSASRAQRPLPTGIVRRQFPSSRVTTWRNNGSIARETALASSTIIVFEVEITNIHRAKLKTSCYNRDQDRSVGVCCHNALGLVRTVRQIPRANALGIWLPVSHAPSCIVTTNPSRTGLNPLIHTDI